MVSSGARAVARCDGLGMPPYSAAPDMLIRTYLSPAYAAAQEQIAEWMRGADTYLEAVRDDDKLEAATRLKAAEILGTLSPMPSFSNVVERHLTNIAFEEALRGLGAAGRAESPA